ncbi:hypothetical protein [Rhodohalobacter sp.]|uniref:hypothetical protein n=1 Tax=Rhodohalobacter sp. TaxID=1974210 RepID=UPI002ACEB021|nr:hypothetical protein [Rhodohalobacter sp.]
MTPGIQQIVTMYGDQINITDEQLADITERQLKLRETMQAARVQNNRANRGQQQRQQVRQGENLRGQHTRTILNSVLSDSQMSQLKDLMKEQADFSHRYTTVRHQKIVELAEIEGEKRDAVLEVMNSHADQRHQLQLKMIENPNSVDADERQQLMDKMQADRDELKSMLTVEEYENLMQFMNNRQNRQNRGMNQGQGNRRQNRQ